MASFQSEARWNLAKRRLFPASSGIVEGHARCAIDLKPRTLDREASSFYETNTIKMFNKSMIKGLVKIFFFWVITGNLV